MNPAILNGLLRLTGFGCLVTGAVLFSGAAAAFTTAGVLLLAQAAPPLRRRGAVE